MSIYNYKVYLYQLNYTVVYSVLFDRDPDINSTCEILQNHFSCYLLHIPIGIQFG